MWLFCKVFSSFRLLIAILLQTWHSFSQDSSYMLPSHLSICFLSSPPISTILAILAFPFLSQSHFNPPCHYMIFLMSFCLDRFHTTCLMAKDMFTLSSCLVSFFVYHIHQVQRPNWFPIDHFCFCCDSATSSTLWDAASYWHYFEPLNKLKCQKQSAMKRKHY